MRNSKSVFGIIITVILAIGQITFGIIDFSNDSSSQMDYPKVDPEVNKKLEDDFMKMISNALLTGKMSPGQELMQLEKDSVFPVTENVKVHLYKKFHLYDPAIATTVELFGKFSKYYFFYDRVSTSASESIENQWKKLRVKSAKTQVPASNFSHKNIKKYTSKNLHIEEHTFTISWDHIEMQGVATLVETENDRFFFHFVSKEKKGHKFDTSFLKKYMDLYLKIE
ncbi:hypothetical protein [uncultured Kordia sp.]|uniref:hypothetical protein n=1 Tax=uncultured Kordia sp. TaxID=507699 RepID=UPI00261E288C|nr:hypothetical protein [uncultured Kordia sp.]